MRTSRMALRSLPTDRAPEAGITLVEMLVVLALIGVTAGAVGLGLGPAMRGPDAQAEGRLLAARMHRASEEALLTGQPVALVWTDRDYRFLALGPEGWAAHPVPLLAEVKPLSAALRLSGPGTFVVTGADLPADGTPLDLRIEGDGSTVTVTWDGAVATLTESAP